MSREHDSRDTQHPGSPGQQRRGSGYTSLVGGLRLGGPTAAELEEARAAAADAARRASEREAANRPPSRRRSSTTKPPPSLKHSGDGHWTNLGRTPKPEDVEAARKLEEQYAAERAKKDAEAKKAPPPRPARPERSPQDGGMFSLGHGSHTQGYHESQVGTGRRARIYGFLPVGIAP